MERYANKNNNSNVFAYNIGDDFIIVQFDANKYSTVVFYKWTYQKAGEFVVDRMKELALNGSGLNSYINSADVKKTFTSKGSSIEEL